MTPKAATSDPQLSAQIAALPCWSGAVTIEPLAGGMTNRNFLVSDRSGARHVVRVGRDLPEHGVLRFNELAAARAAHAAGISPQVVYAGDGMLVSRFVEGRTLAAGDVRDPGQLARIVELVRACHEQVPLHLRGPALMFWVFQVIRNYAALLDEPGSNRLGVALAPLAARAALLEQALGPVRIVFGHNDLLAANFIDDGARLWLIDWDYAGFNSPLFDLANLASNNAFTSELDERLLGAYFGAAVDAACRRGFAAMKCASLLREALWGCVSLAHSRIDFDYAGYARDYLQRFDHAWQGFERGRGA
jgi:thiamine kinase-like enzyme